MDLVLPHHRRREKRVILESVSCASRRGTALDLAFLPAHFFRHLNNRISNLDFLLLTKSDGERASGVPNTVRNAAELFILQRYIGRKLIGGAPFPSLYLLASFLSNLDISY